ncbi:hypothetical protein Hanom_Chr05g00403991 [Helianthus anomalus]
MVGVLPEIGSGLSVAKHQEGGGGGVGCGCDLSANDRKAIGISADHWSSREVRVGV